MVLMKNVIDTKLHLCGAREAKVKAKGGRH